MIQHSDHISSQPSNAIKNQNVVIQENSMLENSQETKETTSQYSLLLMYTQIHHLKKSDFIWYQHVNSISQVHSFYTEKL